MGLREKDTGVTADILPDGAFREASAILNRASLYHSEAAKLGGEPPTALMLLSEPGARPRWWMLSKTRAHQTATCIRRDSADSRRQ
jgi:hypothetical protein